MGRNRLKHIIALVISSAIVALWFYLRLSGIL